MINLTAIAGNIQRRLFEKMRILSRDQYEDTGSPNRQNSKKPDGELTHAKMATRSTFLRMCSGQINPVVLQGGKLKDNNNIPGGYDEIYGPRTYVDNEKAILDTTKEVIRSTRGGTFTEIVRQEGVPGKKINFQNKNKRPMPGLKSADVTFKGGVRALREATVQWVCWDWDELNLLMPHFLAHGKTVLLEWGWVYDGSQQSYTKSFIKYDNSKVPYIDAKAYDTSYRDKVIEENGDFDMMVGIIKNFEFTTREDGGFDCTTIITSVGASILDNPEPNEVALDPGIVYNTSVAETTSQTAAKISRVVNKPGIDKEGRNEKLDSLVDLNSTLSLKLMISKLDDYLQQQLLDFKVGNKANTWSNQNRYYMGGGFSEGTPHRYFGKSNKFLIQKAGTGQLKYNESKISKSVHNAWVRWGWFEDNILSKFLSMVTKPDKSVEKYSEILTEFRSIERVLTPEGTTTGETESVRIKNHSELQTTNINNHIMPGQFSPVESKPYKLEPQRDVGVGAGYVKEGKTPGDQKYLLMLRDIVNDKEIFEPFSTPDDTITKSITEDVFDLLETADSVENRSKRKFFKGKGDYKLKKTGEKTREVTIPGKYGYLRNMLINTKVIRDAFGVGDEFNVESLNIIESLESLFSILNQELNFWSFQVVTDETETNRAKIIDNQVVDFEFSRNNPVSSKQSFMFGEDVITNDSFEPGVFFFPVWQKDSLVKRQNITAKIPDALQLSIMYGTNLDQLKDFANPGAAFGEKEGVFAGALFNKYSDVKNNRADLAFRSDSLNRIGTPDGNPNDELSDKGDDIRKFIIDNSGDLELKLEDRLEKINEELKLAENEDLYKGLNFDSGVPPPVIRDLSPIELGSLLEYEEALLGGKKELGELLGSMFDKDGKMKLPFKGSVGFLTTQHGIYKNSKTPLLIPLELELEIDGIGGIFPGNSCHSTYVPLEYQQKTVFQIFDVNHRIGNEGWTVTLACKMRSNLDSVVEGFETLDTLKQRQFTNYLEKAELNERQRQKEVNEDVYSGDIGSAREESFILQ